MSDGALRFVMPNLPQEVFMDAMKETVRANSHWIPPIGKGALYLRPLLFGSGAALGVAPSPSYTFVVWASPVGSYFKAGKITPINLLAATDVHRAPPKGSGSVKAIGNYAPCFLSQKHAKDKGFSEVLFLDALTEKHVEEAGASNFFSIGKDGIIRTPELGAILSGVTRQSVIQIARDKGYKVKEYKLPLSEAINSAEAFCTGTGASITPIGSITVNGTRHLINDGQVGQVTSELYQSLLDVQQEKAPDKHNWLYDPYK